MLIKFAQHEIIKLLRFQFLRTRQSQVTHKHTQSQHKTRIL